MLRDRSGASDLLRGWCSNTRPAALFADLFCDLDLGHAGGFDALPVADVAPPKIVFGRNNSGIDLVQHDEADFLGVARCQVILFFDKGVLLLEDALREEEENDFCLANVNGDLLLPFFVGDAVNAVVIPDVDLMRAQFLGNLAEANLIFCVIADKNERLFVSCVES